MEGAAATASDAVGSAASTAAGAVGSAAGWAADRARESW